MVEGKGFRDVQDEWESRNAGPAYHVIPITYLLLSIAHFTRYTG